ncbi:MAG: Ig-like domain-containing protein, partial [Lachnospiraceae bacterium]|nr:Ig-like domain-containing protein [Lachnospiraceae bacterium]
MKAFLKKGLTFLIALAVIVQASILTPALTLTTYAETEETVEETVTNDYEDADADIDADAPEEATPDMIQEDVADDASEEDEEDLVIEEAQSEETVEENITDDTDDAAIVSDVQVDTAGEETDADMPADEIITEDAEKDPEDTRGPPEDSKAAAEEEQAVRGTKTGTVLVFTSDVHNTASTASNFSTWISKVINETGGIDYMGFCGDMADGTGSNASSYWTHTDAVMGVVEDNNITACYTTGNHEYGPGDYNYTTHSSTTNSNVAGKYTVDAVPSNLPSDANYQIYCLGSASDTQAYTNAQVADLSTFLENADSSMPIFIVSHYPLHTSGNRSTDNASAVINALNTAADTGKTIIFLWGHNHTISDSHYSQIYSPESSTFSNFKFYYVAAGCMKSGDNTAGKGLVATISNNSKAAGSTVELTVVGSEGKELSSSNTTSTTINITDSTGKTYVQTDKLVAGTEYIIASEADSDGNVLMLSNESTGTARQLKGVSATVSNNTITISDDDVLSKVLFTCEADSSSTLGGLQLKSGGNYLFSNSNDGLQMHALDSGRCWYYKAYDGDTDKHILWLIKSTSADGWTSAGSTFKYYLDYSSGTYFTDQHVDNNYTIQGTSDLPKIYLYVEAPEGDTYTLSYDANGGTGSMSSQTNKTTYTVKTNSFTKEGFEFTKWNTKADGTGTDYEPGASITLTEDTTLYAQWTKATTVDHTVYVLTSSLTVGKKYLIVNTNAATSANGAHAIGKNNSTVKDYTVTVNAGTAATNNTVYIDSDGLDTNTVWTVGGSSTSPTFVQSSSSYLYPSSSGVSISTTSRAWSTSTSNPCLRYRSGNYGNYYYLNYNNGWTMTSSSSSSSYPVYFYEEATIKVSITPGITVEPESATVGIGETKTLTATPKNVEGTPTITWSINNTDVATVDQTGVVTGVAAGDATITASIVVDGVTYSAECEVTVAVIHYIDYVLTEELMDNQDYLLANGSTGAVYLVSNEANGSRTLKGVSANVSDGKITLAETDAEKVVFRCEIKTSTSGSVSAWFKNGAKYLYADNDNGLRLVENSTQTSSSNSGKYWHYKGDDKHLLWYFKDTSSADGYNDTSTTNKYYLDYNNANFTDGIATTTSLANTNTDAIYLFVKSIPVTGIELDKTAETVAVNGTAQLNATVLPATATNKKVNWTSSDETIATVDSTGKVTGVAEGEVAITATSAENSEIFATCTVTVSVVHVTGVSLDSTATVAEGGTIQLTPTITPEDASNKNVSWESSDSTIATVDNDGKVNGVAEGEAIITVTTEDGSLTATCTVTVTKQKTYVIVIDNYALSTESTTDQVSNSNGAYIYSGLAGVAYSSGDAVGDNIRWVIEETNGGYHIKSLDGRYLNATYTSVTNPSASNPTRGVLKLDNTPDVWTLDSGVTLDNWEVNGSKLKSTNADKSMTHEESSSSSGGTAINLFTVRSTGETSHIVEAADYTLSYDANAPDATGSTPNQTGSAQYTVSANGFTREGFVFQKWNTKADGTGSNYAPGDSISLTEDTTLYAQWHEACETHTFGNPVWTWTGDDTDGYTSATLTLTCTVCGTVATATDNDITVSSSGGGDCQTPVGATTYTAEVNIDGVEYSDTKSVGGNATAKVTNTEADGEYVMAYFDGSKYYVIQQTGSSTPTVTTLTELTTDTVSDNMLFVATAAGSFKLRNKSTNRYIYTQSGTLTSNTTAPNYNYSLNESGSLVYTGNSGAYYYSIDSSGAFKAPTTDPGSGNINLYKLGSAQYGPHNYVFQGFTWTGATAKVNYKCSVCEDEQAVDATMTPGTQVDATCEAAAYVPYTASIAEGNEYDGQYHSDTKNIVVTTTETVTTYTPATSLVAGTRYIIVAGGYAITLSGSSIVGTPFNVDTTVPTDAMYWTAAASSSYFGLTNASGGTTYYLYENAGSNATGDVTANSSSRQRWSYNSNKQLVYTPSTTTNSTVYINGASAEGFTVSSDAAEALEVSLYTYSTTTQEVESQPLGHDWDLDNIVWNWTGSDASGWTAATATLTCKRVSSHTITEVAEVTSSVDGNTTTYTASITVNGTTKTDTKVVTAHVHSYEKNYTWSNNFTTCTASAVCSGCAEGVEGHSFTEQVTASYNETKPASCTTPGSGTYTATFTNELFETQTKDVEIPMIAHDLEHHEAVAATCTTAGSIEYWYCTNCKKYFSDADATTEITQAQTVIAALSHDLEHHEAVVATCTTAGNIEYWYCTNCKKYFSDADATTEITQAQTLIASHPDA